MKLVTILAIISLVLLSGCSQEKFVCNEPYIQVGDNCCLDENNNNICDTDENTVSAPNTDNQELSEPEETISCDNKCEGTTFYSNGRANRNECDYATIIENSADCGYEEEIPPVIQIVEMSCRYAYNSSFLAHFKSVSETPIPIGSKIKLLFDDGNNRTYSISSEYSKGQRLWQDVSLSSGWDTQGRNFDFKGINPSNFGRKNQNYAYIYCPPEVEKVDCDKSNGLVLYEGNTIEDCGTQIRNYGYFTPYNDFIILEESVVNTKSEKIKLELESFNLKKSDFPSSYKIVEKYSGFDSINEIHPKYYSSDINKTYSEELTANGWQGYHAITYAQKNLDTAIQLSIPFEQVISVITKFDLNNKNYVNKKVQEYVDADSQIVSDKESTIKEYEDAKYKDTKIEQVDSIKIPNAKIFLFSTIDPKQTLGSGRYAWMRMAFAKDNYFIKIYLEGYSESITTEKIEKYAEKIIGRLTDN